MLLPIPFVSVVYRNYVKSKKFFWVIIALISFIVPYGTIFEGTSRNTIIIPIISLVFIIPVLFKEYRRFIIIFLISSLTIVSIIMIAWKNFTRFGMVVSSSDMNIVGMIQYLELYFAGPSNMGKAVLSWYNANLFIFDGIRMIPNDIFNYVPILSGFTNFSMTTNRFFLDFIGRNDQVIPAMGNGLFYFGVVFAPLVPIVNIKISRIFEKKAYKSGLNVDELTLFSYAAVMLSYNTFNNISSFYMKLTIYILPSIIICFVIKQFCNSIRRKNEKNC